MILLDSDHISTLKYQGTERYRRLVARLATVLDEEVGTTIITVEEQMRGWLAAIARERQVQRQIGPYRELGGLFVFFLQFEIVPFEQVAVDHFAQFQRVRISSLDRKIAAIAIANDALLLTANRRDFEQVPGLKFENWMD